MTGHSSQETRTRIADILKDCVNHALGLKETLQNERSALEDQDSASLYAVLDDKSRSVSKIQVLDEQRLKLCEACGFPAGPDQMEQMIDWLGETTIISNCWDHLIEIATECKALNLTNGAIVNARQINIDSRLSVLRGTDANSDTYERSGSGENGLSKRSLAQA